MRVARAVTGLNREEMARHLKQNKFEKVVYNPVVYIT
jgi:hypothetical protein